MKIEPTSLNIQVHKRSWSWVSFIAASIALAAILTRPSIPAQWLATLLIVAPTVWFVFFGPSWLYYWQLNHRYSIIGWGVFAIRLALLPFVVKFVTPRAVSLIVAWYG